MSNTKIGAIKKYKSRIQLCKIVCAQQIQPKLQTTINSTKAWVIKKYKSQFQLFLGVRVYKTVQNSLCATNLTQVTN